MERNHLSPLSLLLLLGVFALLATGTVAVWRQQVRHQRSLLHQRTEDVGIQASRRLEMFVESRLNVAELFAKRWATHEQRDFSHSRFVDFAELVIDEIPGYHALGLFPADRGHVWVVPQGDRHLHTYIEDAGGALLDEAALDGQVSVSPPLAIDPEHSSFLAVVPLQRGEEFLGFLVVEFATSTLIDGCFHERIRSEFSFVVDDGELTVFEFLPEGPRGQLEQMSGIVRRTFSVRNRVWQLSIAPRRALIGAASWRASLSVPALGMGLTVAFTILVFLLVGRMGVYRAARDRALREVEERRRAEAAQRASEQRYHGVFVSTADGLLVFDMDGFVVEVNPAAAEMHGYSLDGMVGMDVRRLIADAHKHRFDEFMDELQAAGTVSLESVDVRKDGTPFPIEVRGRRFVHDGDPAVLAMVRDVTERERAMKQQAQLSRKILVAQEEERSRVSRDLHDGLGQLLTALRLEVDWLGKRTEEGDVQVSFGEATALIERAVGELRGICRGLRPPLLDDLGLEPAVLQLVETFEERASIPLDLKLDLGEDDEIPAEVALCIYRVLQEALTNIRRHAGATLVHVSLYLVEGAVDLSVSDNGRGFAIETIPASPGFGLTGMQERAKLVNGNLDVRSEPRQGTHIELRVPLGRGGLEEDA